MRGVERADMAGDSFSKMDAYVSFCCGTLAKSRGFDKNRTVSSCIPGKELLEFTVRSENRGRIQD